MNRHDNEHGVALVLSLWMLVLLGLVGSMILAASTVELRIAANDRHSQSALLTADAAVEFAKANPAVYTGIGEGSVTDPSVTISGYDAENVTVTYLTSGPPPNDLSDDMAFDAKLFKTIHYAIEATGVGPNNTQAMVEVQFGKVVLK
ncbi:MAG: pilus assembly PilX family protein [Nitrospirota bacterium]